jgi:hypothetical protein
MFGEGPEKARTKRWGGARHTSFPGDWEQRAQVRIALIPRIVRECQAGQIRIARFVETWKGQTLPGGRVRHATLHAEACLLFALTK